MTRTLATLAALLLLNPAGALADCASDRWPMTLTPGPQMPVLHDRLTTESGRTVLLFRMTVLEGDPLVGDYAKLWVFAVFSEGPDACIEKAVSLGSYASFAAFAEKTSNSSARRFHLDYYASDLHATLGFFDGEPDLAEITDRALAALN